MEDKGDEVMGEEREGEVVKLLLFEITEGSIFPGWEECDRGEE